jgi:hypothetical protein
MKIYPTKNSPLFSEVFSFLNYHPIWPFGIFCGNLVYFPLLWCVAPRNIWQPWSSGAVDQGCQIFLGTIFQYKTATKYTGDKIYQMAVK